MNTINGAMASRTITMICQDFLHLVGFCRIVFVGVLLISAFIAPAPKNWLLRNNSAKGGFTFRRVFLSRISFRRIFFVALLLRKRIHVVPTHHRHENGCTLVPTAGITVVFASYRESEKRLTWMLDSTSPCGT